MADSWKTSRTRQTQRAAVQAQRAAVKSAREIHQTGPWDEDGNLQLPEWMGSGPPMPADWPVWYMWAMVGKAALAGE